MDRGFSQQLKISPINKMTIKQFAIIDFAGCDLQCRLMIRWMYSRELSAERIQDKTKGYEINDYPDNQVSSFTTPG